MLSVGPSPTRLARLGLLNPVICRVPPPLGVWLGWPADVISWRRPSQEHVHRTPPRALTAESAVLWIATSPWQMRADWI